MSADGAGRTLRGRWRLLVVVVVVVIGTSVLAMSGMQDTTVYYVTPTEITTDPPAPTEQIRLGGLVKVGTIHHDGRAVSFVLTDRTTDVAVSSGAVLPRIFQEGQGAVVEGTFGSDGTFRAQRVMVRHSNEYRAPTAGP